MATLTLVTDLQIVAAIGAGLLLWLVNDYICIRIRLRNATVIHRSTVIRLIDAVRWTEFISSTIRLLKESQCRHQHETQSLGALHHLIDNAVQNSQAPQDSREMVAEVQEMQDDLSRFIEGMKKNHVKVERAILEYVESRNGQAKAVLEVHDLAQYSSKPSHALEEAKTLLADYAADTHREVEAFEAHATAYYTNVDPRLIPVIENSRRNSESTVQKDVLQEAKELFRLALLVGSGYHMLRRREAESTIAGAKSELLGLLQRNLQSQLRHVQDESQSTSTLFLKVHERILREGIKGITQSERSLQETLNQQMRLLQEAIYRITEHGGMFTAIARDTNAPGKDIWSEHAKAASKKYEWTRKIIIESCEKKGSRYHEQPAVEGQVRKGGQPNPTV